MSDAGTEVAKLVVGPPGLQAHLPLRDTQVGRIRRWLARDKDIEIVRAVAARAHVHIPEDDDGHIDVYVSVMNLSTRAMEVEQLFFEQFTANDCVVNINAPMFTPPARKWEPTELKELHFRITLQSAAIRQLIAAIQPAQNLKSTPHLQLAMMGTLRVKVRNVSSSAKMMVRVFTPELHINAPSVRSLAR